MKVRLYFFILTNKSETSSACEDKWSASVYNQMGNIAQAFWENFI